MTNIIAPLLGLSKKHLLAIVFAVVCGALVLLPHVIFMASEGSHYKGLYMANREATWFYLGRMQEFYDEGRVGNPYLFEHKFYGPQFMPSGGEMILAIPGKLLGISIPTLNFIYKFILPAITFLLLYALLFRLTASAPWSITGGLFFLAGSSLIYVVNLSHIVHGDLWFDGFLYDRPVHPQFDGMLTFLYFNVLLSALRSQNVRWFVFLGALLGLSFYTYFYSFTFFLALNFVFAVLWFFFGTRTQVRNIVFATIFGILIGLPQLFAIYATTQHPDYPILSAAAVQPIEYGHAPLISKNGLFVSLLFLAYLFRAKVRQALGAIREHWSRSTVAGKGADHFAGSVSRNAGHGDDMGARNSLRGEHIIFLSGLLITTFVVVNQQVITGVTLFPGHYHHSFNIPIFIVVLTFLMSLTVTRLRDGESGNTNSNLSASIPNVRTCVFGRDLFLRSLPWIASVIFIATGAFIQYSSYQNWAPQTSKDQRYMPALSWLKAETPKESVVMANEMLSDLIPVFTSNNVLWSRAATLFLVPADRTRFTTESLLQSKDFLHDIKQYRADYILWDQQADPSWDINRFQLPVLFSSDGLIIYQLPK